MTALTADKDVKIITKPTLKGYPVAASAEIFKGAMVCMDSDGYLIPADDDGNANTNVIGVADEHVDNSDGGDGDLTCRVRSGEIYEFATEVDLTQANVGSSVYVEDDQTLNLVGNTTEHVIAGTLIERVSSSLAKIYIPTPGHTPTNNIDTANIVNDAVVEAKIADDAVTTAKLDPSNNYLTDSEDGEIGFATGAGGTVTQTTDKSTGVTLNKPVGEIVMDDDELADDTVVTFTLTNDKIAATDIVIVHHADVGTPGEYQVQCTAVAAGSCDISVRNISGGSLSEAIVLHFAVIKGVQS
jgi:hypothetical protein